MKKVLTFLLFMFRLSGVDPKHKGFVAKCLRILCLLGAVFILALYVLEISLNWRGVKTLGKINMLPACCMLFLKVVTLQQKNENLHHIITKLDTLSEFDQYGAEMERRLTTIFTKIEKYTKAYVVVCVVVCSVFTISALVTDNPTLYIDAYDLCDISTRECFIFHFIWQHLAVLIIFFPNVMAFDCLFFYLVAEAYCAFEITKLKLRNFTVEEFSWDGVQEVVAQHDESMDFVKELNRFYSALMLGQCCFSTSALIMCLYMITSEGIPPPMTIVIKFGMLYLFFAMQLFIYCLGGTVIMEQSKSVADEAFQVDWWSKTRPDLRKSLTLIIERSQMVEKISVGRIMDLNFVCFVKVLNNSLSVYTLLLTMEKKSNMLHV